MIRETDGKKRKRAVACVLESLEDRQVLSASAAGAAAAPTGVPAQYEAAIDRLDNSMEARVDQVSALIQRRTAQFDGAYGSALVESAAKFESGRDADAVRSLTRSTNTVTRREDAFVKSVDQKVSAFTAQIRREANEMTARYGRRDPAVRVAAPAVKSDFQSSLASVGNTLESEARAARDVVRGIVGSSQGVAAQAGLTGASAMSRADAVDHVLASTVLAQQAADRSAVNAFWMQQSQDLHTLTARLDSLPATAPVSTSARAHVAVRHVVHAQGVVHHYQPIGTSTGTGAVRTTGTLGAGVIGTTGTGVTRTTGTSTGTTTSTGLGTTTGTTGTGLGTTTGTIGTGLGTTTGIPGTATGIPATGIGLGSTTGTIGTMTGTAGIGMGVMPTTGIM